uniref:Protein MCM10 homolog n=1 Tax=Panagrolaimus davidi TaxID=227884 RepID=A0A914QLV6_9BILA
MNLTVFVIGVIYKLKWPEQQNIQPLLNGNDGEDDDSSIDEEPNTGGDDTSEEEETPKPDDAPTPSTSKPLDKDADIEKGVAAEEDQDITPKDLMMPGDKIRDLGEPSCSIVNTAESLKLESSSSAFPFSSDKLKASSSSQPNLSEEATAVGKVLAETNDDHRGEVFDPIFGIRVRNSKITSSKLSTYYTGFKKIRLSHLQKTNVPQGEWVTMGVIVEKSDFIESANGKEYIIWKISDLTTFQDTPIKVLLFGECLKQHWKLQQSSVVALMTAQLAADPTDAKSITLKLYKSAQVIDIGFCPDFGHCKAVTKEGTKCSKYVNISSTEFCVNHIEKAAKTPPTSRAALGSEYLNVKVVSCKKCDYTNEKQSSYCMIHGHLVQWHKANKKFFECSSCKERIGIFEISPENPCKTCGCTSFDQVGMRDERMVEEH